MQFVSCAISLAFCTASLEGAFYNLKKNIVSNSLKELKDEALFLTKYIEKNETANGRLAAAVPPLLEGIRSYSGYLTVNKEYNSNMFFWFFPAECKPETAPVVVWLQGGPGTSSLYGLFAENGPFYVTKQQCLEKREYYWSQAINVIYIDNPVGTGFSFTENQKGYARNERDVGQNLYSAVSQFLKLFPQYQTNDFFIAGESYAGKYVPALAYIIHMNNKNNQQFINLKGISIGNGIVDPENMLNYGDYLYQIGLIDSNVKEKFKQKESKIVQLIKKKQFTAACEAFESTIFNEDSLFANATTFSNYYNYLHNKVYSTYGDVDYFLNQTDTRKSIHVGKYTYNYNNETVMESLKNDLMQSVKPWFEVLIENYRVLVYNGQLDIIVAYPLTLNFLKTVSWSGAEEYRNAKRKPWHVNGELAGFSKTVKGFNEILVRDAGHMVPFDQPLWAFDLITRFAFNKTF